MLSCPTCARRLLTADHWGEPTSDTPDVQIWGSAAYSYPQMPLGSVLAGKFDGDGPNAMLVTVQSIVNQEPDDEEGFVRRVFTFLDHFAPMDGRCDWANSYDDTTDFGIPAMYVDCTGDTLSASRGIDVFRLEIVIRGDMTMITLLT